MGRFKDLNLKKLNKLDEYLVLAGDKYFEYLNGINEKTNKKKLKKDFETDLVNLQKKQKKLKKKISVRGLNNNGRSIRNPLFTISE